LPVLEYFPQQKKQDAQKLIQQLSQHIAKCWE